MMDTQTQTLLKNISGWKAEDAAHEFLFTRQDWHLPAAELTHPQLVLDRSFHVYSLVEDDFPVDVAQRRPVANWYAQREGYMALGIKLIALVLSDVPCLTVTLSHAESRIKNIYFYKHAPMKVSPLLTHEPVCFTSYLYIPDGVGLDAFSCADPALSELAGNAPLITNFSWWDQAQGYEQTAVPDGLVIAATPQRMADLGALLIDFGREETKVNEIAMESALDGAGGVSHGSVEQKFWLPGTLAFPEPSLDALSLPQS